MKTFKEFIAEGYVDLRKKNLVYYAIERATLSDDHEKAREADTHMGQLINTIRHGKTHEEGGIHPDTYHKYWVDEKDHRSMNS